jgi:hypothetical protein
LQAPQRWAPSVFIDARPNIFGSSTMGGLDPPIQKLWLWMAGSEAGHGDGEE